MQASFHSVDIYLNTFTSCHVNDICIVVLPQVLQEAHTMCKAVGKINCLTGGEIFAATKPKVRNLLTLLAICNVCACPDLIKSTVNCIS